MDRCRVRLAWVRVIRPSALSSGVGCRSRDSCGWPNLRRHRRRHRPLCGSYRHGQRRHRAACGLGQRSVRRGGDCRRAGSHHSDRPGQRTGRCTPSRASHDHDAGNGDFSPGATHHYRRWQRHYRAESAGVLAWKRASRRRACRYTDVAGRRCRFAFRHARHATWRSPVCHWSQPARRPTLLESRSMPQRRSSTASPASCRALQACWYLA